MNYGYGISTKQMERNLETLEEYKARELAANALGVSYDAGLPAIQAEMAERVHEALELMDWIEDTLPMFDDDYSDWIEETQSLRHGG